jgi:tetratricopeptide (TPR) repeat protein
VLQDAALLYKFILIANWPEPDFDERSELLSKCVLSAWRAARRGNQINACTEWLKRLDSQISAGSSPRLETPCVVSKAAELRLDDPVTLLSVCSRLRKQGETSPLVVRDEAEFLYDFLVRPECRIGLLDEREYFLGESALLAGAACRMLFRCEEARRWFDRAESAFRHTANAVAEWSRVRYQRLALKIEEREFEEILEAAPSLVADFEKLEMAEDALKCRFLEGVALLNTNRLAEASEVFLCICNEARSAQNAKLLAIASNNLVQIHGLLGESARALIEARETLAVFRRLNNRVGIAKLQFGMGALLRAQGQIPSAIEAYRAALIEFREIGMRSEVAAAHLVVAELLLEIGQEAGALREVLAALPTIEHEKMVPEGVAALSLLRESFRHQKINRQALRDLHGYFEEIRK